MSRWLLQLITDLTTMLFAEGSNVFQVAWDFLEKADAIDTTGGIGLFSKLFWFCALIGLAQALEGSDWQKNFLKYCGAILGVWLCLHNYEALANLLLMAGRSLTDVAIAHKNFLETKFPEYSSTFDRNFIDNLASLFGGGKSDGWWGRLGGTFLQIYTLVPMLLSLMGAVCLLFGFGKVAIEMVTGLYVGFISLFFGLALFPIAETRGATLNLIRSIVGTGLYIPLMLLFASIHLWGFYGVFHYLPSGSILHLVFGITGGIAMWSVPSVAGRLLDGTAPMAAADAMGRGFNSAALFGAYAGRVGLHGVIGSATGLAEGVMKAAKAEGSIGSLAGKMKQSIAQGLGPGTRQLGGSALKGIGGGLAGAVGGWSEGVMKGLGLGGFSPSAKGMGKGDQAQGKNGKPDSNQANAQPEAGEPDSDLKQFGAGFENGGRPDPGQYLGRGDVPEKEIDPFGRPQEPDVMDGIYNNLSLDVLGARGFGGYQPSGDLPVHDPPQNKGGGDSFPPKGGLPPNPGGGQPTGRGGGTPSNPASGTGSEPKANQAEAGSRTTGKDADSVSAGSVNRLPGEIPAGEAIQSSEGGIPGGTGMPDSGVAPVPGQSGFELPSVQGGESSASVAAPADGQETEAVPPTEAFEPVQPEPVGNETAGFSAVTHIQAAATGSLSTPAPTGEIRPARPTGEMPSVETSPGPSAPAVDFQPAPGGGSQSPANPNPGTTIPSSSQPIERTPASYRSPVGKRFDNVTVEPVGGIAQMTPQIPSPGVGNPVSTAPSNLNERPAVQTRMAELQAHQNKLAEWGKEQAAAESFCPVDLKQTQAPNPWAPTAVRPPRSPEAAALKVEQDRREREERANLLVQQNRAEMKRPQPPTGTQWDGRPSQPSPEKQIPLFGQTRRELQDRNRRLEAEVRSGRNHSNKPAGNSFPR